MAQAVAVDPEEALIGGLAVEDLDRRVAHDDAAGAVAMGMAGVYGKSSGRDNPPVCREMTLTCRCAARGCRARVRRSGFPRPSSRRDRRASRERKSRAAPPPPLRRTGTR